MGCEELSVLINMSPISASAKPAVSVVVPVFNEAPLLETVIQELLQDLLRLGISFEIILSENGSTDGSAEITEKLAGRFPHIIAIHAPQADYGYAMQRGFMAARGEAMVNFSIDFIDVNFLRATLPLLDRYDIVLGSKHIHSATDHRPWLRRVGGRVFHWIAEKILELPVKDTHGIKLFRRDCISDLVASCTHGGALFDTELILRAYRAGVRLYEFPVSVKEVRPSKKNIVGVALRSLIGLLQLRLSLLQEKV